MNKEKSCGGLKSDIGVEDGQKMGRKKGHWKCDNSKTNQDNWKIQKVLNFSHRDLSR